jgi:uncharacterized protein YqgC (DUF456 family)
MENLGYSLGVGVVFLAFFVGFIGILVPVLPGILLIWLGALFYAWVVLGFDAFSPWVFVLITLIGLVAGTANIWLTALGAKKTGASWRTLLVAFIGGIAGTFLIPIPILGTIIGCVAGLILSEYVQRGEFRPAVRAAVGGVVGWGVSTGVELIGAVLMMVLTGTQAL